MAFCSKCGAQNADGAKFCNACGAPLPPAAEPTWQAAPTGQPAGPSAPTGQPTWQAAPSGGQYAPAGQQTWAGPGTYGMAKVKQTRGWLGVFGAIIVFISMFALNLFSVPEYDVGFTYLGIFSSPGQFAAFSLVKNAIAFSVALLILAAVLYILSNNKVGLILSIASFVLFWVAIMGIRGTLRVSIDEMLRIAGIGFWLIIVGYIVMILSVPLKNVNEKINAAFGGNKR